MADELNIDEQYELIFGKKDRPNIFSADDEEYKILRQGILESKRECNLSNEFPFSGIKLMSYEEYKLSEIANEAIKRGNRVFYIKQYVDDRLTTYAAGYFDVKTLRFTVLRESFFVCTQYFTHLVNSIADLWERIRFRNSFLTIGNVVRQTKQLQYDSASLAASCFLGEKTYFGVWKDDEGYTLDVCYPQYRVDYIRDLEDKTFPDYVAPKPPSHQIVEEKTDRICDAYLKDEGLRVFYLSRDNDLQRTCMATGTYNPITQKFILRENSLLSYGTAPSYTYSSAGVSRSNLIAKYCSKEVNGFRLKCDIVCDSPSTAAGYALGRSANGWKEWKDGDGITLDTAYRNNQ